MLHEDVHQRFEQHFLDTYGIDKEYSSIEYAYQFGYDVALSEEWQDQPYDEAEDALREEFARRYPDIDFDSVREAVRFAFTHTRLTVVE